MRTNRGLPVLAPLGVLFGLLAACRVACYRRGLFAQARLQGPVVSVGNLAVGGSGKTPLVAYLAALLREAGLPVAILSRGYGGSFRGECLIVSDGRELHASAAAAGDEPLLLARELPGVVVAVGPQRDRVGRAVEARFGPRVHLLDDGFQHLRLFRDLDLVCLDAEDRDRWPLPAGRLREFPAAARRADLVLLTRAERASPERLAEQRARHGAERVVCVRQRALGCFSPQGAAAAAPRRPFLVSGIARPERFADDARALCGALAGEERFGDHHAFTPAEVEAAQARALQAGADALLTTAKDFVRWPGVTTTLPVLVLRLALEVDEHELLHARVFAVARRLDGEPMRLAAEPDSLRRSRGGAGGVRRSTPPAR